MSQQTVTFRGHTYKLKGKAQAADMPADEGFEALIWINRNTYAKGRIKATAQALPCLVVV